MHTSTVRGGDVRDDSTERVVTKSGWQKLNSGAALVCSLSD